MVKKRKPVSATITPAHEPTRRDFLKGATTAAAGLAGVWPAAPASPGELPTVALGSHRVSRLIIGSNPIYGYSHFNILFDRHMTEWFTDERIVQVMQACERTGINTWQASYNSRMRTEFPMLRSAGCKIQFICLASGGHLDKKFPETPEGDRDGMLECAEAAAAFSPIGIAHHGSITDRMHRAGKLDLVRDFVNKVHDLGSAAGISTHNPIILAELESKGWNHDFYMTSLYYQTRRTEEFQKDFGMTPVGETYLATDPPRMLEAVRKVSKPCLVYKLLAAGRRTNSADEVRRAFEFAYRHMKPMDAAIVGMYPRYHDQVSENGKMIREILA